ncbi:voltage-gated chloride channel family protein [soil metagenome]
MLRFSMLPLLVAAMAVGLASGVASGVFLETLHWATDQQTARPSLLYALPIAGAGIAWLYHRYGRNAAAGNNLLLDQIHAPTSVGVPLRMFPLVLVSTIVTHLFGGSAGREGTAVQMGGAIAGATVRRLGWSQDRARTLLMCGISGGFSGVFGTPLAGTVFGMEMLAVGGMRYEALIPCLIAAIASNWIVQELGVAHAHYVFATPAPAYAIGIISKIVIAGIVFGLVAALFSELTGVIERRARQLVGNPILRTTLGGCAVVLVTLAFGTRAYNGLSLQLLSDSFTGAHIATFAFAAKLALTALTLGVGFKGGEVTPLFVIGATLGVTLAGPLNLSPDFLAALGFVAVFAAAANTPLACVVMSVELFGGGGVVYFGIAIFVAYTVSGHRGIYHAQRIVSPKLASAPPHLVGATLKEVSLQRASPLDRVRRRHQHRSESAVPPASPAERIGNPPHVTPHHGAREKPESHEIDG